jgi:hypothetical protein
MAFKDIPPENPFVRLFYKALPVGGMIWSSHGIWRPAREGMTQVRYTYYFYAQPNTPMSFAEYKTRLSNIHDAEPTDTFNAGSGRVANYLLTPLAHESFYWTARTFVAERIANENPGNLGLLAFMGGLGAKVMSLQLLDQQLLPSLHWPLALPIRMIVCRSLNFG